MHGPTHSLKATTASVIFVHALCGNIITTFHFVYHNVRRLFQVWFLCISAGAINNDTYQSLLSNDILKYLKTMERKHPKHRARYSHTAWLHSTVPDPIQSNMIDRYVVVSVYWLNRNNLWSNFRMTLTWKGRTKQKQQTNGIERFDWFIERIQTHVAFGWLSKRSGEKTSCPRTF